MGIYGNIQNNIVVIYEIKSFYVTLVSGNFFQIIYIEQITILPTVKNWEKNRYTTILPLGGIVYRKKPQQKTGSANMSLLLFMIKRVTYFNFQLN
jgi:hypothetical protein